MAKRFKKCGTGEIEQRYQEMMDRLRAQETKKEKPLKGWRVYWMLIKEHFTRGCCD